MTAHPNARIKDATNDNTAATKLPVEHAEDEIMLDANYADDDAVSTTSTSSTEEFNHESFHTFQDKVTALCQDIWPGIRPENFKITRMGGGGYNRVIGIKINPPEKEPLSLLYQWFEEILKFLRIKSMPETYEPQDLVIRIPRSPYAWVMQEVAMVEYLNELTNIPAPVIKICDLSSDNKIEERYTIQPRITGQSIIEMDENDMNIYERMNTNQRICLARDIGSALAEMGKCSVSSPGTLDPIHFLEDDSSVHILQFQCPNRNAFHPASDEAMHDSTPQTVFEFLETQFKRQREYDISCNRIYLNPWEKLWLIVAKLNDFGFFEDNSYYLTHMDFEPRNIMADTINENTAKLTAILDWDEAVFAPAFLNCCPPSWLWDFGGDEDLDESKANEIPEDPDLAKVKSAFEEAVGPTYLRYAYTSEYRLARTICRLAITCVHSNNDWQALEDVITKWNELYPEWKVKSIFEIDPNSEDDDASDNGSEDEAGENDDAQ